MSDIATLDEIQSGKFDSPQTGNIATLDEIMSMPDQPARAAQAARPPSDFSTTATVNPDGSRVLRDHFGGTATMLPVSREDGDAMEANANLAGFQSQMQSLHDRQAREAPRQGVAPPGGGINALLTPFSSPPAQPVERQPVETLNDRVNARVAQYQQAGETVSPEQRQAIFKEERAKSGILNLPDQTDEQLRAQQIAQNTPLENFSGGFGEALGGTIPKLITLVAPEYGAQQLQAVREGYPTDPTSVAASVGQAVGSAPKAIIPGAPLLFGAEAAGEKRAQIAELNNAGENISGGREAGAAIGTGIVNSVGFHLAGKLFHVFGGRLADAIASGAAKPIIESTLAPLVGGGGTMAAAHLADNINDRLFAIGRERPLTEGLAQSAVFGAMFELLGAGSGDTKIAAEQYTPNELHHDLVDAGHSPRESQAIVQTLLEAHDAADEGAQPAGDQVERRGTGEGEAPAETSGGDRDQAGPPAPQPQLERAAGDEPAAVAGPSVTPSRSIVESSMNDLKRAAAHFGIDPEQDRSRLIRPLREIEVRSRREGSLGRNESLLEQVPPDVEMRKPDDVADEENSAEVGEETERSREPARQIDTPGEFDAEVQQAIEKAKLARTNPETRDRYRVLANGVYQRQIDDGRMTAHEAIAIIEAAGLEVPRDIRERAQQIEPPAKVKKGKAEAQARPKGEHTAIYNGKEVAEQDFKVAAQRVRDNLRTGNVGYVIDPSGKAYKISTDSKLAKPATAEEVAAAREPIQPQTLARDPNIPNPLLGTDSKGKPISASQLRTMDESGNVRGKPAPATGKLDQLESWASDRIKSKQRAQSEKLSKLAPEQRRSRGSAGSLDPEELALHAIVGAAKIAKGVKRFADWSIEMAKEVPDLTKAAMGAIWRQAQRLHRMDDDGRAQWVRDQLESPQEKSTKQIVRENTGQVNTSRLIRETDALEGSLRKAQQAASQGYRAGREAGRTEALSPAEETVGQRVARVTGLSDPGGTVKESDALRASMSKAQKASSQGYRAGIEESTGIRKEFARIVKETLPPGEREKLLTQVAKTNTLSGLRYGIGKVREALASHVAQQALDRAEKLTGTLKLDPPDSDRAEMPEGDEAAAIGAQMVAQLKREKPLRVVDLNKLPDPYRQEVRNLIAQAKGAKAALRDAKTIEEKYAAADRFTEVERKIREQVAEHDALKQTRIGDKVQLRESVVGDLVDKIDAKPTATSTAATTDAPHDANVLKRFLGRGSLSMQTIASHIDPEKGSTWGVTIDNIRTAQEKYLGEQHRWTDHLSDALDAAGYPRGSAKFDRFLNNKETVTLPDAGKLTMTRDQMVGLLASSGDPETMNLIRQGVKWNFRNNPLAHPFDISERDLIALNEMISPGERSLSNAFKSYNVNNVTAPLMNASIRMRGWAPDPHVGYFPRARNRQQNVTEGVPGGWRASFKEAMENISALKERAPDLRQPLLVPGFIATTDRYINDAAKVIHLAEPVRTAAMVWEDPRAKAAIEQKFGPSMNRRVDQFLLDTMQVKQKPPAEWYDKASNFVTRNLSRAWLQLNPAPVLKNVLGGTTKLLPEFDAQDYAHGVSKMFSPEIFRRMLDASDVAWHRYNGGLYGQYSPITGKHIETIAEMRFSEALKVGKIGAAVDALPFMEWADSVPFRAAFAAAEHFVERTQPQLAGDAKQRAVLDKFHDAVYATQNGTSSTEISGLASGARKNSLASPWFLFTSDNNKSYNMIARLKDADASTRAKTALAVGLNAVLNAAIGYGLHRGATKAGQLIGGADEDQERLGRDRRNMKLDVIKNLFGTVYGVGTMVDWADAIVTGHSTHSADPVQGLAGDAIDAVTNIAKAIERYASTVASSPAEEKASRALLRAAYTLAITGTEVAGLPIAPAATLIRRALVAGGYTPPDPRYAVKREAASKSKSRHDGLPGNVQSLLAERGKLGELGRTQRTDEENDRYMNLRDLERIYAKWQRAETRGDADSARDLRAELAEEAKRISEKK